VLLDRTKIVVVVLLLCISPPAEALELCPELAQLYAQAEAASSKVEDSASPDRCYPYVHYSVAWSDLERYARKHQETCGVSPALLADIKRRHHAAVTQRVNACGGVRETRVPEGERRLFPPEIRPLW
jgi:hypothetical protein